MRKNYLLLLIIVPALFSVFYFGTVSAENKTEQRTVKLTDNQFKAVSHAYSRISKCCWPTIGKKIQIEDFLIKITEDKTLYHVYFTRIDTTTVSGNAECLVHKKGFAVETPKMHK